MPPKAVFKGQTFALSGKLALPRKEYEETIRKHGGDVAASVTTAVTFLISTEDDVKAVSQKVATALGRKLPVVQEGFVGACVTAKRLLEPGKFAIKAPVAKKRAASKGGDGVPPAKAARAAKAVAEVVLGATPVMARSGLEDKAAVVEEKFEKGFVKGSLLWDVELVLNDVAAGKDKFYNMQLLAATAGDQFWTVQNWGKTGMAGRVHTDGPFADLVSAKRNFRRKYRAKTGNVFGELGASFLEKDGKYKVLAKDEKKSCDAPGVWQYYPRGYAQ
ncbi:unnamed protein product [Prorocentrum cordatum]|uniref:NAD(+) ADP-ribosyltransferase n=1 Tax=Prorocentrum cordatum TaxID=2364126 RepID=A0ABN9Q0X4_9DINO|nr:unnamed protein product [Polarella glacialis]